MKSKGTVYLLWCVSIFGWLGLQHLYLGKPIKGLIWFLTGGVFGFGAFIDIFTLGNSVDNYNTNKELRTIRKATLSNSSNRR